MAPRGIGAFVIVGALIFSMTIIGGIGYYSALGTDLDVSSQNEDVQQAANEIENISFGEGRSNSILQGPLAAVTPVVGSLQMFTTVVKNTSGVLQLLYGIPKIVADTIETVFLLGMLVTILYAIRSGTPA